MIPLSMRLHLEGLDDRIAALEGLEQRYFLGVVIALEWFGSTATQEMITQHSFMNRTGRLERSIGYHIEGTRGTRQAELHIYALAPYAVFVEEGIPGRSRPYPFFWPSFYKWLPELYVKMAEVVEETFRDAEDHGRLS